MGGGKEGGEGDKEELGKEKEEEGVGILLEVGRRNFFDTFETGNCLLLFVCLVFFVEVILLDGVGGKKIKQSKQSKVKKKRKTSQGYS